MIAGHAEISVAAARQALIAHEKAGTAMRVKGGRPGIPDTWKSAAVAGIAEGGELKVAISPDSDPAVTAEAAGNVLAVAWAAEEAGKALAAGDLPAALGRRALKAAANGRHASATRPGALRDLVEEHLRTFPDAAFTPHQIGKVLTRSAGAVANALDKLVGLGTAELASDNPRSYRLAPAPAPDVGRRTRFRHQHGGPAQRRVTCGTRRHAAGTAGRRPGRVPLGVPGARAAWLAGERPPRYTTGTIGRKLKGDVRRVARGQLVVLGHRVREVAVRAVAGVVVFGPAAVVLVRLVLDRVEHLGTADPAEVARVQARLGEQFQEPLPPGFLQVAPLARPALLDIA